VQPHPSRYFASDPVGIRVPGKVKRKPFGVLCQEPAFCPSSQTETTQPVFVEYPEQALLFQRSYDRLLITGTAGDAGEDAGRELTADGGQFEQAKA
jgi:hypothetical protein